MEKLLTFNNRVAAIAGDTSLCRVEGVHGGDTYYPQGKYAELKLNMPNSVSSTEHAISVEMEGANSF